MSREKILTRSLEVNMTEHCNLSCYGCDHASPVRDKGFLSLERLRRDSAALAPVLRTFEFRLTGGEPLLHPELLQILDAIRTSGMAEKIVLVTNGVLLHRVPEAMWGKIDKMWVSVYPGVRRRLGTRQIERKAAAHGVSVYFKMTHEFSAKLLHRENQDGRLVREIYSACLLRSGCHTLHEGRYYKCSPSPFMADWLTRVGLSPPDLQADGVSLHEKPQLRAELEAYLQSDEPLASCRYCLGTAGRAVTVRQLNRSGIAGWLGEKEPEDLWEVIDRAAFDSARARVSRGLDLTGQVRSHARQGIRWRLDTLGTRAARTIKRIVPGNREAADSTLVE